MSRWRAAAPAAAPAPAGGFAALKARKAAQERAGWKCAGCYVVNESAAIECVSCEMPMPGCEEEVKAKNALKMQSMKDDVVPPPPKKKIETI